MNKAERKKQRRIEAEQRQAERAKRTNQDQLALIETRRGNSVKEKARLLKRIEEAK